MPHSVKRAARILGAGLISTFLNSCGSSTAPPPLLSVLTQTQESACYIYHLSPGDSVNAAYDDAFCAWISAQVGVKLSGKIQYYKFKDAAQLSQLTGNSVNGYSNPANQEIYSVWPADNHETTHVFTAFLGTPPPFFNEGMAVANQTDPLAGVYTPSWNGLGPHFWAKQLLQQGIMPSISGVIDQKGFSALDPNATYPMAGSFVRYLIDTTSMATVLKLFPGASYSDSAATTEARFQAIFDEPLTTTEQNWHAFLLQYQGL